MNGTGLDYNSTSTSRCSATRANRSSRWCNRPRKSFSIYSKKKIKHEAADRASIWTDTNVYNELGIPAIKIGPRGRRIGPRNEEIDIDAMVNAAKLYALIALDICTRVRS